MPKKATKRAQLSIQYNRPPTHMSYEALRRFPLFFLSSILAGAAPPVGSASHWRRL
jgi:hypothetical protein